MKTTADRSLDALLAEARSTADDAGALEWGFETRVLARLREEERGAPGLFNWAWRLCPFFAVLAIVAGLWSRTTTARVHSEAQLLSEAAAGGEARVLLSYMTRESRP